MSVVEQAAPRREAATPPATVASAVLLHGVDWATYEKFLDAVGRHRLRLTYDQGTLELMSPLPVHEIFKNLFGRLFDVLAEELDFPFKAIGSVTCRIHDGERGLEADNWFYLANAARVRDWNDLDLSRDPPPDLAIEVDVTRSSLDRLGIYAALRVPEVWRFDGAVLRAHLLQADGSYLPSLTSRLLPQVPLAEIVPLLHQSLTAADDREVVRALRRWVKERVVTQPSGDGSSGGASA